MRNTIRAYFHGKKIHKAIPTHPEGMIEMTIARRISRI
jgi:hypothetical protein